MRKDNKIVEDAKRLGIETDVNKRWETGMDHLDIYYGGRATDRRHQDSRIQARNLVQRHQHPSEGATQRYKVAEAVRGREVVDEAPVR